SSSPGAEPKVLAGTWWDIRNNCGTAFGSAPGLELTRSLEVAWSLVTIGGSSSNAATATTARAVLTLDDDDGNLAHGTPNYGLICPAFANHNIQCPIVTVVTFVYPDGRPTALVTHAPATFRVNVVNNGSDPLAGSGQIFYRTGGTGSYQSAPLTELAP